MQTNETLVQATDPQIEAWFTYHAPSADQQQRYQELRAAAKNLAYAIKLCTRPSADQSAAYRLLRECVMTANASIALENQVATPSSPASASS